MRRFVSILLAAAMVLSLAACGSSTTTSTTATEETAAVEAAEETTGEVKQFRVGMECAYAPSNWQEDTATDTNWPIENVPGAYAEGNDVQIAKHIAESLGYELVIVKLAWSGLIEALNQGQIDAIIAGMADTEERRQSINFSTPYHRSEYCLLTLADSEYADRTSIHDTVIDQMEGVNHLSPVDSVPNMLSRLEQGTCDAIVVNKENTPGYLALNSNFVVLTMDEGEGFDLGFVGACVGIRMEDTDLLEAVNTALADYSDDDLEDLWNWAVEHQPT
jgi:ABC-type amino acid transport substrate-binding protein